MIDASHQQPLTDERWLVTFALFAYNQEKYIREAVEGAFSQTYEPLEIILSDDCSTDKTFDIMEDMVSRYRGRHKVVLNKNKENKGLIRHVNTVFSIAKGRIIVAAAGDDVSIPTRADVIVSEFNKNSSLFAIHSKAMKIDNLGNDLGESLPFIIEKKLSIREIAISASLHIGATAAYRKKLYETFGPIEEIETYEDLIYGFRASLLNGIGYIDSSLVKYRVNIGISNQFRLGPFCNAKKVRIMNIEHNIATLKQRRKDCTKLDKSEIKKLIKIIDSALVKWQAKLLFYQNKKELVNWLLSIKFYSALYAYISEIRFNFLIAKAQRKIST